MPDNAAKDIVWGLREMLAEVDGIAREALQTILDMGCPLGREGDLLGAAQRIASEAITELNRVRSSEDHEAPDAR